MRNQVQGQKRKTCGKITQPRKKKKEAQPEEPSTLHTTQLSDNQGDKSDRQGETTSEDCTYGIPPSFIVPVDTALLSGQKSIILELSHTVENGTVITVKQVPYITNNQALTEFPNVPEVAEQGRPDEHLGECLARESAPGEVEPEQTSPNIYYSEHLVQEADAPGEVESQQTSSDVYYNERLVQEGALEEEVPGVTEETLPDVNYVGEPRMAKQGRPAVEFIECPAREEAPEGPEVTENEGVPKETQSQQDNIASFVDMYKLQVIFYIILKICCALLMNIAQNHIWT